jgi:hypothetical protein
MATLLVLTPMVGATGIASFAAPYTAGVAVHHQDPVAQGCGARLTVSHAAKFDLTTGVGTGAASAKSTPCATSDSQATYDATTGVRGLAFTASSTGTFTTTAAWTITWNASASMTSKAAAAGAQSTVEIWLLVKLTDASTGKVIVGATHFVVQKDLGSAASYSGGAVGASYSATVTATLTSGHSYRISAVMGFDVAAVIPQGSPTGAIVSAAVDLGSAGHGGTLASITVA